MLLTLVRILGYSILATAPVCEVLNSNCNNVHLLHKVKFMLNKFNLYSSLRILNDQEKWDLNHTYF